MNLNHYIRPLRQRAGGVKCWTGILSAAAILAALTSNTVAAAPPATCDLQLIVKLTPDVPNSSDAGFLSSLVGNHPGYQLILRQQRDDSTSIVDLIGPGPDYRCQSVVEAMRRDGRVLSIRVK